MKVVQRCVICTRILFLGDQATELETSNWAVQESEANEIEQKSGSITGTIK